MARTVTPLTLKDIRTAKPQSKLYRLYDGNGLQLCVYPSGKKVWRFDYLNRNSKRTTLTIGDADLVSLADARSKREEFRRKLVNDEQLSESSSSTFKIVFYEWWERWKNNVSEKHSSRARATVENDCFPIIENLDIAKIKPKDIVDALTSMEKRGALEQLQKTRSILKLCFDSAVARGLCEYNPVLMVSSKAFESRPVKNHRSLDPKNIGQLYEFFKNDRFNHSVRLCTEFILLTIVRANEATSATWEEVDLDKKLWVIPAERMKMKRDHIVPLSDRCVEILNEVKTYSGHLPYVFPNYNMTTHINRDHPLMALKRSNIDTTIHGLRHLASTLLNESGHFRSDVIEACLAHQDKNSIRATYNKAEYIKEKRLLLQWWSNYLDHVKTHGYLSPCEFDHAY